MDGDLNKKYWTNFDLLKEVQRICTENKLPCFTKGHDKVAVEILDLLGEISLSSSPSQEDKNVITNFKKKYFRVIKKFKPYKQNYEKPTIKEFGNEIFWEIKEKNNSNNSQEMSSSQASSSSSQEMLQESERAVRSMKSLGELKLGSTQMRRRLKPVLDDVKKYASSNKIEVTQLLGLLIHTINYPAAGEGSKEKAAIGLSLFKDDIPKKRTFK